MRQHNVTIALCAAGFAALIVAALVFTRPGPGSSASPRGVNIGIHTEHDEAMRAALRRIAADMRREPNARKFTVQWYTSWLAPLHWDPMGDMCLEYDRTGQRLDDSDEGGEGG